MTVKERNIEFKKFKENYARVRRERILGNILSKKE